MKWILGIVSLLIIIAGVLLVVIPAKAPTTEKASIPDLIEVDSPMPSATVSSPMSISGTARGTWYFEASAPAQLLDQSGAVIAQAPIQAQGDWMTTDYVPFSLSLPYPAQPAGSHGTLILKNDNPSGDPSKGKSLSVPVVFK